MEKGRESYKDLPVIETRKMIKDKVYTIHSYFLGEKDFSKVYNDIIFENFVEKIMIKSLKNVKKNDKISINKENLL